jgi:hypothetical protein
MASGNSVIQCRGVQFLGGTTRLCLCTCFSNGLVVVRIGQLVWFQVDTNPDGGYTIIVHFVMPQSWDPLATREIQQGLVFDQNLESISTNELIPVAHPCSNFAPFFELFWIFGVSVINNLAAGRQPRVRFRSERRQLFFGLIARTLALVQRAACKKQGPRRRKPPFRLACQRDVRLNRH